MYICLDCDSLFESPRQFTEEHGFICPPYEAWWGCPKCGGAYMETHECDQCGQYIVEDYIELEDGTLICDACYEVKNLLDSGW